MGPVVIETERLRLREWTAEDVDGLFVLASDPEVTRYLGPWGATHAEVESFVERQMTMQRNWGWCRWAVELREPADGFQQGVAGFSGPGCTFAPDIEVGWTLRRKLWGKGLATEVGRAAVDYCFSVVGFDRLICCVDPENAASLRVAAKVGFVRFDEIEHHGCAVIRHELLNPLQDPPRDPRFRLDCVGAPRPQTN